jgi:hypothetical protein
MSVERNAATGYAAIKKETTKGTAVTPTVYTPYYKQKLATDFHLMSDSPVFGNRFKNLQHLKGNRSHGGSITVMAEPDTLGYWLDMLLYKSATSGSNPYTHTFGLDNDNLPNSYTLDVALGGQVVRFAGVQASNIKFAWADEKMQLEIDVSALKSFYGREIASVSTNVLTLKTDYDDAPTDGLVASDLVQIQKADGSVVNTTVSSITGTTVTVASAGSGVAAGDMIVLRPATPSFSTKTPFLWGKTRFFFAADAATALTNSATASNQTRLEPGTELELSYDFEDGDGSKRSGGFDPASLIRTVGEYKFKCKQFFDTAGDIKTWNALTKKALLVRSYSGSTNQYELQLSFNNMTLMSPAPESESGSTIYSEQEFGPNYDSTDGAGMTAKAINSVSTI